MTSSNFHPAHQLSLQKLKLRRQRRITAPCITLPTHVLVLDLWFCACMLAERGTRACRDDVGSRCYGKLKRRWLYMHAGSDGTHWDPVGGMDVASAGHELRFTSSTATHRSRLTFLPVFHIRTADYGPP